MRKKIAFYLAPLILVSFFLVISIASITSDRSIRAEGMVYIPGGKTIIGSDDKLIVPLLMEVLGERPKELRDLAPRRKVYIKGFYMDRYEMTNTEYQEFVNSTKHAPPIYWDKGRFPDGGADYPVINIMLNDAMAYCRWKGKRLPTDEEWERAASGGDGRFYPWGNKFVPGWANTWESKRKKVCRIGSYEHDCSPYGVFDMAGNAMEWTSSWDDKNLMWVIKGGSWVVDGKKHPIAKRVFHGGSGGSNATGFRCAKSASPIRGFFLDILDHIF